MREGVHVGNAEIAQENLNFLGDIGYNVVIWI